MNPRRRFLAGTTTIALTSPGLLTTALAAKPTHAQLGFASSFDQVRDRYGPTRVRFDNPLPADLRGTLFRNGPARMKRGPTQYRHWFDGDGLMHSFQFDDNGLTHRGRMINTTRSRLEAAAGRFLWPGFGTGFSGGKSVLRPDDMNVANTSVLPVGDKLLALWEGGSAWQLNAQTLETEGRHVFSAQTDGLPFSAHPRTDPGGRIWNFGCLSGSGKLLIYDLLSNGKLNRVSSIDVPNVGMVHDFAITRQYLVFVVMPMPFDSSTNDPSASFMSRIRWEEDKPVLALVVDKESLTEVNRFEIDPFFAFHFGNAWEDKSTIRLEVAQSPGYDGLMTDIVNATIGAPLTEQTKQQAALELRLDLKTKRTTVNKLPLTDIDFPRFDQRHTGEKTSHLFALSRSASMPAEVFGFNSVTSLNRSSETVRMFDYGSDTIAEEHIFVADSSGKEATGWLVGTAYNWRKQRTTLSVFNAHQPDAGPIATAALPYGLPLGLHGQFVKN